MEILCSFRLILEGKTGKEILEITVAGNVFSKQLCFIRCRRQHLWSAEQRRYNRSIFVKNTVSNLPESPKNLVVFFRVVFVSYRPFPNILKYSSN